MPPILTHSLAQRLEMALAEGAAARLAGAVSAGIQVTAREFGHVLASRVDSSAGHYHYFSSPRGLQAGDEALVAPIVEWYGLAPLYVRLAPPLVAEPLLGALSAAGLRQSDFMSVMYGPARSEQAAGGGVREDREAFARLWTGDADYQRLVRAEFAAGWRCFVALLDDQPVAYGGLFIASNGVGVCAAAATLTPFRGRGCQTALLAHRMAIASQRGCELVVAQAAPDSASQRNMQRIGMQLAWTGVTWTR